MKKYLLLLVLLSLFNSAPAMEVSTPVKKLYSIEAEDGKVVKFPQSLVDQCQTLVGMVGDLGELKEGEVLPVCKPSTSLQLLIDFHNASEEEKEESLADKSLEKMIALFKVGDFLEYEFKTKLTDGVVSRITPSISKDILMNKLSLAIGGEQEAMIVERFVHIALKPLITSYSLSRGNGKALEGHTSYIWSACITPDRSKVITWAYDDTVRVWNIATTECEKTFLGKVYSPNHVSITSDGSKLIIKADQKTAKIWDIATGSYLKTFEDRHAICSIFSIPNTEKFITGLSDGATIWDIETGESERLLGGLRDWIISFKVTPDCSTMIAESQKCRFRIWDLETLELKNSFKWGHPGPKLICMTPDSKKIIIAEQSDGLMIWNIEKGNFEKQSVPIDDMTSSICVTPDGRLITGSSDGTAKIWNLETGVCEGTLSGHTGEVLSICVTTDGTKCITGSSDGTAKIWNLETKVCEGTLSGHTAGVRMVCVTPDGSRVITVSGDRIVNIWDIYDSNLEKALKSSPLKQALLCYYALVNKEAAEHLIEDSTLCKEVCDSCDPGMQAVITGERSYFEALDEGSEEESFELIPEDDLAQRSLFKRILTRRNALIGAGVLGTGVGFYAAYKWWFTGE